MAQFRFLKEGVGLGFKGFGLFWGLSDRFLCNLLCKGTCTTSDQGTCALLFLFVGIIFIICGYAIVTTKYKKRKKARDRQRRKNPKRS